MINKTNKKGAVEMSLNLIIMLVIGLTVLGLVIAFVTNFLNQADETFGDKLSEAEEREKDVISSQPGIFAAGPSAFRVSPNGKKNVFIKIKNPTETVTNGAKASGNLLDSDGNGGGDVTAGVDAQLSGGADGTLNFRASNIDLTSGCTIDVSSPPFTVGDNDEITLTATMSAGNQCRAGESFSMVITFTPVAGGATVETAILTGTISNS